MAIKKVNPKPAISGKFLFPGLIFLCSFLIYGNTIRNDYAVDDGIYTRENDFIIKGFSAFADIFNKGSLYGNNKTNDAQYRPLTLLNFMTEHAVFGFNPHVSHFFNVLIFALLCVLLYYFLKKILNGLNPAIPLMASLLFVFHPIHTETVANIKSRDELLGFFFALSALYLLVLSREKKRTVFFLASLAFFLAAVFSKENYLSFAAVVPLLLYFFSTATYREIALKTIPYVGIALFYVLVRMLVMHTLGFEDKIDVMSNSLMSASSSADQIATSLLLLGKYVTMNIVPYPLSWDYSFNQIPVVSWGNSLVILSVLSIAGLLFIAIRGLKSRSLYSFAIVFFFVSIFLSSNLVIKIGWTFAERFLFAPSLGFCLVLPLVWARAVNTDPYRLNWPERRKFYIPLCAILLLFSVISIHRNTDWKNNFALFTAGVKDSPNSARAHLALAGEYGAFLKIAKTNEERSRLFNLDLEESKRAIAIYGNYTEAYNHMGTLYLSFRMNKQAKPAFLKSLAIEGNNYEASNNLGAVCADLGEFPEAIRWLKVALKSNPEAADTYTNLGAAYQKMGNADSADYWYNEGVKRNPSGKDLQSNLFLLYFNSGKGCYEHNEFEKALNWFLLAYRQNQHSEQVTGYLGALYHSKGDFQKAIEFYKKSLEINPSNESIRGNLSQVLELQNRKQ